LSTILKALKRLDEQRRADAAPRTLEEQVLAGGGAGAAREGREPRRRTPILFAGGTLALLAVAGVSYLWLSREQPPVAAAAAPERVAAAPTPLPQAVARAPRESLPARGAPITGDELDPSVRSALHPQPARGDAAFAPGAASARPAAGNQPEPGIGIEPSESPEAQRAPVAAVASAREQPPRVAARSVRDEPRTPTPAAPPALTPQREIAPTSEPEPPPRVAEAPPTPAAEEPAPTPAAPREPDVAVVAPRPEIWVESTEWHPSPEKRSARIRVGEDEARNLHEGDAVDGVIVKEIRPSGVLFLYEGAEFKRGVGGS